MLATTDSSYGTCAGSSFAKRRRMTTIERDSRNLSGNVNASEPANASATLSKLGRKKVVWILVGVLLMSLVALLAYELSKPDGLVPILQKKAEGCACTLSKTPLIKGHWHQQGGAWQCLPGVGAAC
jgi:hypothetical protein